MEVSGQLYAAVALGGERTPGIHWLGGWVGPRIDLEKTAKRNNTVVAPAGDRTPVVQPVA